MSQRNPILEIKLREAILREQYPSWIKPNFPIIFRLSAPFKSRMKKISKEKKHIHLDKVVEASAHSSCRGIHSY